MKTSEIQLPKVIGISGSARSGKDTLCLLMQKVFEKHEGKDLMRAGFADAVKGDLHGLLVKKAGISAYTEVDAEKKLIRPLMVAYGTQLMRKMDPMHWVKRMEPSLDLAKTIKATLCITDVRYKNEIEWIKENEGITIYVDLKDNSPANAEEKRNDKMLREKSDLIFSWEKVGKDKILKLKPSVLKLMKQISC